MRVGWSLEPQNPSKLTLHCRAFVLYPCAMSQGKPVMRAPDGSAILRHQATPRGFEVPATTPCVEEIEAHIAKHFGKPTNVFHELVSDRVHIDVHFIPPGPGRNHWTLFTTGMSALPMSVPQGAEDYRYAELMISLPANWKIDALSKKPPPKDLERWYWPVRWLKKLARLPHDFNTWLGTMHTIPNGDPPRPLAPETRMSGWMLLPPIMEDEEASYISLSDGRVVYLYFIHALHANEMDYKLKHGGEALLDKLAGVDASEILNVARPSGVGKK